MDFRLLYSVLLTLLPVSELRIGLPLAIAYAIENNISIWLVFFLILLLNILLIFIVFWFLDNIHYVLMNVKIYKKFSNLFLKKFQKKVDKFERRHESLGFLALTLFVAVPLPGTGVWSGSLISWLLGLDRKKSMISIVSGVIIAGILILLGTLGIIKLFF